jgi:hypothetical protein
VVATRCPSRSDFCYIWKRRGIISVQAGLENCRVAFFLVSIAQDLNFNLASSLSLSLSRPDRPYTAVISNTMYYNIQPFHLFVLVFLSTAFLAQRMYTTYRLIHQLASLQIGNNLLTFPPSLISFQIGTPSRNDFESWAQTPATIPRTNGLLSTGVGIALPPC